MLNYIKELYESSKDKKYHEDLQSKGEQYGGILGKWIGNSIEYIFFLLEECIKIYNNKPNSVEKIENNIEKN